MSHQNAVLAEHGPLSGEIADHVRALLEVVGDDAEAETAERLWFIEHVASAMLQQRREEMRELSDNLATCKALLRNKGQKGEVTYALLDTLQIMLHVADDLPLPLAQARLASPKSDTGKILGAVLRKEGIAVSSLAHALQVAHEHVLSALAQLHDEGLISVVPLRGENSVFLEDAARHLLPLAD